MLGVEEKEFGWRRGRPGWWHLLFWVPGWLLGSHGAWETRDKGQREEKFCSGSAELKMSVDSPLLQPLRAAPIAGRAEPIGLERAWRFWNEAGAPRWVRATPPLIPPWNGGTLEEINHPAHPLIFQIRTLRSNQKQFSASCSKSYVWCMNKQVPMAVGSSHSTHFSCLTYLICLRWSPGGLLFALLLFRNPGCLSCHSKGGKALGASHAAVMISRSLPDSLARCSPLFHPTPVGWTCLPIRAQGEDWGVSQGSTDELAAQDTPNRAGLVPGSMAASLGPPTGPPHPAVKHHPGISRQAGALWLREVTHLG